MSNNAAPTDQPFALEDVVDEIRAMALTCDEHILGVRKLLPWQKPFKQEELKKRKQCYLVAAQLLGDLIKTHRVVVR